MRDIDKALAAYVERARADAVRRHDQASVQMLTPSTYSVTMDFEGGGNGNIYGSITVAKFDRNGSGGFLAPAFTTNGGGNSTLQYDSDAVRKALNAAGPLVMGVREF